MSQEALAEKSGVSARTISDIERGLRRQVHLETVRLLSVALALSDRDRQDLLAAARPELLQPGAEGIDSPDRPAPNRSTRNALPIPPTPLIGREKLVRTVSAMLEADPTRIVTLTGTGGVGKTRLAIEIASETTASFANGAVFVNLAPVADPEMVPITISRALGMAVSGAFSLDQLLAFLEKRQILLLLDNFEHLLDAAPVVAEMNSAAPDVVVLSTSRIRLRLAAEIEVTVPPLNLPDKGASLDRIRSSDALQLFSSRATALDPSFFISDENAEVIAEICRRLDGLPLAIELATPRLRVLSVQLLLHKLETRLPLLMGGSRDLPVRQQSMRATIAWSYDLLSEQERQLFRWLAVFSGGFSLQSAEAAGASLGLDAETTFAAISSLVEYGLIHRSADSDGAGRFQMLETIREFGLEMLAASQETENAKLFHATHFLEFAELAAPSPWDPVPEWWIQQLSNDYDNLLSGLDHVCQPHSTHTCVRFASAMGGYYYFQQPVAEGWEVMKGVLDVAPSEPTLERHHLLYWAAHAAMLAGYFEEATTLARETVVVAEVLGNRIARASAMHCLGWIEELQQHFDVAVPLLEESLELWRALGNEFMQGVSLMLLGGIAFSNGDLELARSREQHVADLFIACAADPSWLAATYWYLGIIAFASDDLLNAAITFASSLRTWVETYFDDFWFKPVVGLADVSARCGEFTRAVTLLGAADHYMESVGYSLHPFDEPGYERASSRSRAALGDSAYAHAYEIGRTLTTESLLAEAEKVVASASLDPILRR